MVGGEHRDVDDSWPVLMACGNPVHLGPLGSGQVAKACNQMIVDLFRLLAGGHAGSRILETRSDRIVREDYTRPGPPDTW